MGSTLLSSKKTIGCMLVGLVIWATAATAAPVGVDTARMVARNWMAGRIQAMVAEDAVDEVFTATEDGRPVYYVFNFVPRGWVMVAADDVAYPVIGYALEGAYALEGQPPPFRDWMQRVGEGIDAAASARVAASARTTGAWQALMAEAFMDRRTPMAAPAAVDALLTTTWNQNKYYNAACPVHPDPENPDVDNHTYAGCVATAMAQVMKYHAYPESGLGSHGYQHGGSNHQFDYGWLWADFGAATYNWAAMPDAISDYNDHIADLIYHCGVSVEMDFGPWPFGSSANMSIDTLNALKDYFKYEDSLYYADKNNHSDAEWATLLKTELDAGRPMLYAGPGHVFICDGYNHTGPTVQASQADQVDFFHFNWGWGGDPNGLNGFYMLDDLTPGPYNYTDGQSALVGLQEPLEPTLSLPYSEGFEGGIPAPWIIAGERVSISTAEARSDSHSLLLGDDTTNDSSIHTAVLKLAVPSTGAVLSFWVKRGRSNPSGWNRQSAWIKPEIGPQHHLEIFDDDFADAEWQPFSVDLSPWAGTIVRIYFQQDKSLTNPYSAQWMYIDDVTLNHSQPPQADFSSDAAANCGGTITFEDNSTDFPTAWQWSFPGGDPATSSDPNPSVTYDAPGLYNVSLAVSNIAGTGTTESKNAYIGVYDAPDAPPSLCLPTSQYVSIDDDLSYSFGITKVILGTIDSPSDGTVLDYEYNSALEPPFDGAYRDFTCTQTTRLKPDTDYSLWVTVGHVNFEDVSVFIDYNGDGDFDDNGELILSMTHFKNQSFGDFRTPTDPVHDRLLRMRVISDWSGNPINSGCDDPVENCGCYDPEYGQAEDYGVVFPSVWPSNDQRGDVNGDTSVDLTDALTGLRVMAFMPVPDPPGINLMADVDGDGCIGPAEVAYILWICAGSPP